MVSTRYWPLEAPALPLSNPVPPVRAMLPPAPVLFVRISVLPPVEPTLTLFGDWKLAP